jgi:hypothetical protein
MMISLIRYILSYSNVHLNPSQLSGSSFDATPSGKKELFACFNDVNANKNKEKEALLERALSGEKEALALVPAEGRGEDY